MNHDPLAPALERLIDQFMIVPAAVARRGVDEVDAEIECPVQCGNRLVIIRRSVGARHAHTTERQTRNFELRRAELYVIHDSSVPRSQLPQVTGVCQTWRRKITSPGKSSS